VAKIDDIAEDLRYLIGNPSPSQAARFKFLKQACGVQDSDYDTGGVILAAIERAARQLDSDVQVGRWSVVAAAATSAVLILFRRGERRLAYANDRREAAISVLGLPIKVSTWRGRRQRPGPELDLMLAVARQLLAEPNEDPLEVFAAHHEAHFDRANRLRQMQSVMTVRRRTNKFSLYVEPYGYLRAVKARALSGCDYLKTELASSPTHSYARLHFRLHVVGRKHPVCIAFTADYVAEDRVAPPTYYESPVYDLAELTISVIFTTRKPPRYVWAYENATSWQDAVAHVGPPLAAIDDKGLHYHHEFGIARSQRFTGIAWLW
jgi:hypothetical protein